MKVIHRDNGEGRRMALIVHWLDMNREPDDFKAWDDYDLEVVKNELWSELLFDVPKLILEN